MNHPELTFASDLTEAQRKTFSERLLTLNNLLEVIPDDKYQHAAYIDGDESQLPKNGGCGTAACALGHAVLNKKELFPALKLKLEILPSGSLDIEPLAGDSVGLTDVADEYFGPGADDSIFSFSAYEESAFLVKREEVRERITHFVRERFGYEAR